MRERLLTRECSLAGAGKASLGTKRWARKRCCGALPGLLASYSLSEAVEEGLRGYLISGAEALGEPILDRCQKLVAFSAPILVAFEPGEACGGTQFPGEGVLTPRQIDGLYKN